MAFRDRVRAGWQVRHTIGPPRDSEAVASGGLRGRRGPWSGPHRRRA